MSALTPKRTLARPRPSLTNGINTASTPNLAASYNSHQGSIPSVLRPNGLQLARKSSLSALTEGSLATIPDASAGYALSTVLDEDSPPIGKMAAQFSNQGGDGDIQVGDLVDVPGSMFGTVKFVGSVDGKKGVFAGVELSEEYASRGKNNGEVDGLAFSVPVFETSSDFIQSILLSDICRRRWHLFTD